MSRTSIRCAAGASGVRRVLCAGVGTGAELLALARFLPGWRFVAVEPSGPMLDVCRRKAEAAGLGGRCAFHAGYVHELPAGQAFDAPTAILVSQFLTDRARRVGFCRELARRLRPGGIVVTADLVLAPPERHESLLAAWRQMMRHVGASEAQIQARLAAYGREVALVSEAAMEALLEDAGLDHPVHFSQALLIHAWHARRP